MSNEFINYKNYIDGSQIMNNDENRISGFFRNEQMSASLLKAWSQCPTKALIEQVLSQESEALTVGSKVHELLEKFYKENLTKEILLSLCTPDNLELDSSATKKVKDYINAYFNIKDYSSVKAEHLTEQKIVTECAPLDIQLPIKLLGFIDRIDIDNCGDTVLIDYKTGSRAPNENMYIEQMIFYKWLYEAYFGQKVKDVYVASLFKDDPKYIKQNITLQNQSELIDKIFKVDEEVKTSLKNYHYPKKQGYYCKWCPIQNKCSKGKEGEKIPVSNNPFL